MVKILKSIFTDNLPIKLFSLLSAVLLWMYASARGQSEVNFVVPLELRDVPAGMMAVGEVPGPVDVRLKGYEDYIKGLSSREVGAFISLKGARVGESLYSLTPSNIKSPGNITIVRVSPAEIRIRLDTVVQKRLAVKPETRGKPAPGYSLAEIKAVPDSVPATGPKTDLGRMEHVSTEPIDLAGLMGGFEKQAGLEPPASADVRLEVSTVKVLVNIEKKK